MASLSPHWITVGLAELVGHQSGAMTRGTQPRQFAGRRMLVIAAVFAGGVLLLKAGTFILMNVTQFAAALCICLLPFIVLAVVSRMMLGRWAAPVMGSVLQASRRLSSILVGSPTTPSATNSVAGRIRAAIRAGRIIHHVPVRHFQLHALAGGSATPCLLLGDPDGTEPNPGDLLRLTGRRDPSGDFVTHRIEVLGSATGPTLRVIRGRLVGPAATIAWWSRACYFVSAAVAGWAVITLIDIIA